MAGTRRVRVRNGDHGYGLVTKALHWTMFAAIAAQFVLGYVLDADDGGRGRGRGRGGGSGTGQGRGRGGDSGYDVFDDPVLTAHVVLGLTILTLAAIRLVWRITTPLPPWASTLSHRDRTLAHWTERALYLLMFAIPLSGLWLIAIGDDDALAPHVVSHVAFFIVFALHLGLVAKHQFVDRDRLLRRML